MPIKIMVPFLNYQICTFAKTIGSEIFYKDKEGHTYTWDIQDFVYSLENGVLIDVSNNKEAI